MEKIILGKKDSNLKYDFRETCFGLYIKDNKVLGKLTIDVHGNIVGDNQSFINEDKKASYNTNINNISLEEAINNNLINIIENRELLPILEYYYKDKIKKKGKTYGNRL